MKSAPPDSPLLYLTTISLLLVIILLMVFRRQMGDPRAGKFLLGYFFCYFFLTTITYLFVYGNPAYVIHTLRTGHIAALLMPVFAFFYMRQSLYPTPMRKRHWIHLFPAVFFLIDFFPFYLLSGSEKQVIFEQMDLTEYRIGFSQGWLMPTYAHFILRLLLIVGYWVAQAFLLIKARRENYHPLRLQYPHTWQWLHIFWCLQAVVFTVPFLGVFVGSGKLEAILYSMASAGTVAVQCFYLLLHPEILQTRTFKPEHTYQHTKEAITNTEATVEAALFVPVPDTLPDKPKMAEAKMTDAEIGLIEEKICRLMQTHQPFLKQRYTLHDFASDTRIAPHKLSAFINARYGVNFNDYLNKNRIAMVEAKLRAGENALKTLEAIAQECGFQSRVTFIRAFKKEHQMTPSEFLEQLKP